MNRQDWLADWQPAIEEYRQVVALSEKVKFELEDVKTELRSESRLAETDRHALTKRCDELQESLAVIEGEREAALKVLESSWEIWWRQEISLLLRSSQGKSPVLVTLTELCDQNLVRDWHPWLIAPQRQARRLIRLIDLVQMMEERSFPDYRVGLDQALEALQSEAEATLEGAAAVANSIKATSGIFPGQVHFQANVNALGSCIDKAFGQSRAIATTAGQPTLKSDLADAFRNLWDVVSKQFGTWQRRIRPSINLATWTVAGFLMLYIAVCAWIPSELLLAIFLLITASAAIWRYYLTREFLDDQMTIAKSGLRSLDPGAWSDSDDRSIWNASSQDQFRAFPDNLSADLRHISRNKWSLPSVTRGLYAIPVIATVVAMILSYWVTPTPFDVVVRQSSVRCTLAHGRIVWAGPGQVVMYSKESGFAMIPSSTVALIGREHGSADYCGSTSKPSLQITSFISTETQDATIERSYVLPVFTKDVHCPSKTGGYDWRPDSVFGEPFNQLLSAFGSCAVAGKPVKVRVLGYSSSKEFVGCDDARHSLNKKLAAARRRYIIEKLREPYTDAEGVLHGGLTPQQLEIEPAEAANDVNDKVDGQLVRPREFLSRHAEIQIVSAGDCGLRTNPG